MANEKLIELARKMVSKTRAGELPWEQTLRENVFSVSFPKYSVSIVQVPETDQSWGTYTLSVFNETGRLLDTLTADEARQMSISLRSCSSEPGESH